MMNVPMRATIIKIAAGGAALLLPTFVFATNLLNGGGRSGLGDQSTVFNVFDFIETILNILAALFLSLAIVYFLYALSKFVLNAGDEEARKEARSMMIHSIIAIAVMVSVWALVGFIVNTVGRGDARPAPELPL